MTIQDAREQFERAIRADERERLFSDLSAELNRWDPKARGIHPADDADTVERCAKQVRDFMRWKRGGG